MFGEDHRGPCRGEPEITAGAVVSVPPCSAGAACCPWSLVAEVQLAGCLWVDLTYPL